jgi:hypothetical protein
MLSSEQRREYYVSHTEDIHPEPPQQIPAGWYPDDNDSALQRWWTGEGWTGYTRSVVDSEPGIQEAPYEEAREAAPTPPVAQPQARQSKWFRPFVVAAIAVVMIAVGVILAISITNSVAATQREAEEKAAAIQEEADEEAAAEEAAATEAARRKLLPDAVRSCGLAASIVQDAGTSVFLNSEGDSYGSGDLSLGDLVCVLVALDTPDAVTNHMSNTRPLDGTQSDTWDDFSATWTYHPDNGLDVILTLTE